MEWCSQCLTPVRPPAAVNVDPPDVAPGEHEPASSSTSDVHAPPEISMTKPGPYQYGIVGRLVWTAIFVVAGLIGYAGARVVGHYFGTTGLALVMLLLGVYVLVAVIFLWGVWRPTRVR
jgi:predicted phage tail protein